MEDQRERATKALSVLRRASTDDVRDTDPDIPADVLRALTDTRLVTLGPAASGGRRLTVTPEGYKSLAASIGSDYRTTLAKLRDRVPVPLDELMRLDLIRVADVSKILGVSHRTANLLVANGRLPYFKVHNRSHRVPYGAVVHYLAERLVLPRATACSCPCTCTAA
ncbi:helix-turn-helix transcriptional regulator [Nonomuraea maritima]|uniref:helix-turn-helix transcriptional regulator n=1 Tax=Nonomuraea maritima TaxID=683260 RepID=UPI00371CE2AE